MRPPLIRRHRGFTLIELMVVIVVVGILAAIAYPNLMSYIQRSRRSDAVAALTAVVQAQERYRSNHSAYAQSVGTASGGLGLDISAAFKHYDVALTGLGEANSFASGYTATATPRTGSPQVRDTKCATLSIKLEGSKFDYLSTDSAGAISSSTCWSR